MRFIFLTVAILTIFSVVYGQNNSSLNDNKQTLNIDNSGIPSEIIHLNNAAVKKVAEGNHQAAIIDFQKILAQGWRHPKIKYNLGISFYKLKQFNGAIEIFLGLVKTKPDFLMGYVSLAVCYLKKGDRSSAINYFRQAARRNPNDAKFISNLGTWLYDNGEFAEALKFYNMSLAVKPDYEVAFNNRGTVLFSIGKEKEALNDFRKAVSLNPNFAEAFQNLGIALRDIGKKDESHQAFIEAVRLRPDWGKAIYNLGVSFLILGDRDSARNQMNSLYNYDTVLAEKFKTIFLRKYVVNASSFIKP